MAEWTHKRFWKQARVIELETGWTVSLDERRLKTPSKLDLQVSTHALADAIAAEWEAQEDLIDPQTMPMTRFANSAIEKVAPQFDEVAAIVASYGETDLLCYRADGPEALLLLQAEAWDPLLDWARSTLDADLAVTAGVLPVAQPEEGVSRLRHKVSAADAFALTALHDLVSLSGSLVIGLAALDKVLPVEELWRRSRIDESWQERNWGVDEEAAAAAAAKREDFLNAARFYELSRTTA